MSLMTVSSLSRLAAIRFDNDTTDFLHLPEVELEPLTQNELSDMENEFHEKSELREALNTYMSEYIRNESKSDTTISELYDKFARINRIDQAIFKSEQEIANGAEAVDAEIVFAELEKKHFG